MAVSFEMSLDHRFVDPEEQPSLVRQCIAAGRLVSDLIRPLDSRGLPPDANSQNLSH
ncbi:MAG: hypothetical protein ACYDC1_16055 [Limisphaerales bacterium]